MKLIINSHGYNAGMHYHRIRPLFKTDVDFAVYDLWKDLRKIKLSDYDFIIFNGSIAPGEKDQEQYLKQAKEAGLKIVVDADDYWHLPAHHPMRFNEEIYKAWQNNILLNLKYADIIWTTTPELSDKIKKITKVPIWLIRNAIDYEEYQWFSDQSHRFKMTRTRLGYIGGRTHYRDLDDLKPAMSKLWNDHGDKIFVNVHGLPPEKPQKQVERVWKNMVNNMIPKPKYFDNAKLWKLVHWSEYGFYYDYNDIVVSSVKPNEFNACKSELKIIEAGAKWTPIVCSDFVTYSRVPGIRLASSPREWFDHLEELLLDKSARDKYARELGQYVREEYQIKRENEFRLESLSEQL